MQGDLTTAGGQASAGAVIPFPRPTYESTPEQMDLLRRRGRAERRRLAGDEAGERYADELEAAVAAWPIRVLVDLDGRTTDGLLAAAVHEEYLRRFESQPGEFLAVFIQDAMADGERPT